jgi:hypothetical protein
MRGEFNMAIRGAIAKQNFINKILEIYGADAAVIDKVLRVRIPDGDGADSCELKITLTAAKDFQIDLSDNRVPQPQGEADLYDLNKGINKEESERIKEYIKMIDF